jgi:hypothetical protein
MQRFNIFFVALPQYCPTPMFNGMGFSDFLTILIDFDLSLLSRLATLEIRKHEKKIFLIEKYQRS